MEKSKVRLRVHVAIFAAVMVIAIGGTMYLEGLSLLDAIYFSIVTVATVGYGDISPKTPAGKILALVIIFTGVSTFLAVAANATELFLSRRDDETRLRKLNMVMGLFFSEAGTRLLRFFTDADPALELLQNSLVIKADWGPRQFSDVLRRLKEHPCQVRIDAIDLASLKCFLTEKSELLVGLMENPYMLEHETFSDLVIAVLHLKEELESRDTLTPLPQSDLDHLAGDMNRIYAQLSRLWLTHMEHLKGAYPFLFSLAVRKNPFDREASVVVRY